MSVSKNSVGIDYHSSGVQVCVLSWAGLRLGNKHCLNDVSDVSSYISSFGPVESVAIEACTGSSNFADELMKVTGWVTKLCHPGYVRRMKSNPDKTDWGDAQLLSDLNRVGYLPEVWLAPESLRELRALIRYRFTLVKQQTNVKLRVKALLRTNRVSVPKELGTSWNKKWQLHVRTKLELPEESAWILEQFLEEYDWVQGRIRSCEKRIKERTKSDPWIKKLITFRGIGLITATVIRAEIGFFSRFKTGKQLSRYCGLTPRNASSGERIADSGLIKAGNPILKTVLIEMAHNIKRYDPKWNAFASELRARGKLAPVIAAAVANRWTRALFHEMKRFEVARACN